ncbi:hypothetical protein CN338_07485 [Bacillus cereus]|nr:hypothetical protein CN338_07485 [Bacillus cereus]
MHSRPHHHCGTRTSFYKKRIRSMLGLKSFRTVTYILSGIEAMHMVKKDQPYSKKLLKTLSNIVIIQVDKDKQ